MAPAKGGISFLKKSVPVFLGATVASGGALIYSFEHKIRAGGADADRYAHAPDFRWPHQWGWESYDVKSIRRGYEVYKSVCASCHGVFTVAFRMLRKVIMTPDETKAEAARYMIEDGPGDDGEMFKRPGIAGDYLPPPYPNDMKAAYANGGKAPPNLGVITFARDGYENYIFALLTGYQDPPAGFNLEDGLHFNPYFHGGAIAMPPPLYNEVITYKDGTPATQSQLAKDVACFLRFAAEPWHDDRKKTGLKVLPIMALAGLCLFYSCRMSWAVVLNRQYHRIIKNK